MEQKEKTTLRGHFHLALVREGSIVEERNVYNTVTAAGKASMAGLILTDVGGTAYDNIAIGTGTTAPATSQTTLVGEKYRSSCTGSQQTTTVTNDTARLTCSINITATNTMSEAGVFNATASGTMLARATYSSISVNSGDTLNIGYDIAVA
jgi:hypothetical protein